MSMEQALVDLGQRIGIAALAPGPNESLQLRFASGAVLGVARQGEQVVVHLSEPVAAHEATALLLRAMKRAAQPEAGSAAIQPGLFSADGQDWLVLALRLGEQGLDARELERAMQGLQTLLQRLRSD
ncbi:CesT family type III secretion system chaperone [Comamonas sp. NLF-1-9]|uniref:CesT family type III secretion system chaperone n=1 Tax=Comamonas sp. NLF-1-9 TaxID=2853163 RepID=UPI001C47D74D|nr:CesT family type III secretion system chaperone [Comamonas sp. NLF-1-9]QXL83613.1 CesT family type III secretion system chaperone [Comamonas sp. NLF-1-9]